MSLQTEIIKKIQAYQTIIIHRHVSPDPDALGSQGGLAEIIRATYPDKKVYKVGSTVGDLAWLSEMQTIDDAVYQGALVIAVDTADTPRISDQRFNQGNYLIKIDHHPNDDPYGDITWVETSASSSSELIVDLVNTVPGELQLPKSAARLLLAGIIGDTGRFMYSATTPHTFEVAAQLLRTGIDASAIAQKLSEVTLSQAQLQSYVFNHLKVEKNGAAHIVLSQPVLQELGLTAETASAAVSTPGRLGEVQDWSIFVEKPDGTYRVHLRSKGPIINELAKAHDGGGHPLASGAKAADKAEITQIIREQITLTTESGSK